MKTVAIVVNTEYHLLVTASLLVEGPFADEDAHYIIIEAGEAKGARFKGVRNREAFGVEYQCWHVDPLGRDLDGALKQKAQALLNRKIDTLVMFLESLPLNVYLAKNVKRRGGRVVLAPDGMKPYYDLDFGLVGGIKHRARKSFDCYRILVQDRLWPNFSYRYDLRYGHLPEVDELWATYPHRVRNRQGKAVRGVTVCRRKETRDVLCRVFDFDVSLDLPSRERVVFYVNNVLFSDAAFSEERRVIEHLVDLSDGSGVFVKLHPQTPQDHVEALSAMGVSLIQRAVPAELYIAHLTHSIVASGWSTSLTTPNPTCRFYWLTEYFRARDCMYEAISLTNPTDHIREPSTLDEMAFPEAPRSAAA